MSTTKFLLFAPYYLTNKYISGYSSNVRKFIKFHWCAGSSNFISIFRRKSTEFNNCKSNQQRKEISYKYNNFKGSEELYELNWSRTWNWSRNLSTNWSSMENYKISNKIYTNLSRLVVDVLNCNWSNWSKNSLLGDT